MWMSIRILCICLLSLQSLDSLATIFPPPCAVIGGDTPVSQVCWRGLTQVTHNHCPCWLAQVRGASSSAQIVHLLTHGPGLEVLRPPERRACLLRS
ncbi:hypothetical protein BDV19DRAFT_363380 [Aspergillus venezuelensis]